MSKYLWNGDQAAEGLEIDADAQHADARLVTCWECMAWDAHKGADVAAGEAHAEMRETVFALIDKLPARMQAHHLKNFALLSVKKPAAVVKPTAAVKPQQPAK